MQALHDILLLYLSFPHTAQTDHGNKEKKIVLKATFLYFHI